MVTSKQSSRRPMLYGSLMALAATGVCVLIAFAKPIPSDVDSFETLPSDFGYFSFTPIPADFFDPGSDPFMDIIGVQGVPLGLGATTDTVLARLDKAKFSGPPPKSATVPVEIVALSLTSVTPITVTYSGGLTPELWDVHAGLSPSPQPMGSMTLTQETKESGAFALSLPILLRLTFTRVSDGAIRVLDLPSLDLRASAVPWTTTTTTTNIIHSPGFCAACDSPDGDPANMFLSGSGTILDLVPATTIP